MRVRDLPLRPGYRFVRVSGLVCIEAGPEGELWGVDRLDWTDTPTPGQPPAPGAIDYWRPVVWSEEHEPRCSYRIGNARALYEPPEASAVHELSYVLLQASDVQEQQCDK